SEARSVSVVITLSFLASAEDGRSSIKHKAPIRKNEYDFERNLINLSITSRLKRMRSVGAERELQLYKRLVRIEVLRVAGKPILAAQLRELAGPVSQHQRTAFVCERGIKGTVRTVHASTDKPAAGELVVRRRVKAEGALKAGAD